MQDGPPARYRTADPPVRYQATPVASDDGLGWAFLDQIEQETDFAGLLEYRYQLQVEDAALVRDAERVIFIDSYKGGTARRLQWKPCEPSEDFQFTTHVLPPRGILHFCQDLYGRKPRADLLMIQGASWDLPPWAVTRSRAPPGLRAAVLQGQSVGLNAATRSIARAH